MRPSLLVPHLGRARLASTFAFLEQNNRSDAYKWNTTMRGLLEREKPKQAYMVYLSMRRKGLRVDSYTLLFAVRACGFISRTSAGEQVHGQVFKTGFQAEIVVQTAVMEMYAFKDNVEGAQRVFDETPERDLAMYNAIICRYARNNPFKALEISRAMVEECLRVNGVTAVSILSACSSLGILKVGKMVHGYLLKSVTDLDIFIYNALIDMYMKSGSVVYARLAFENMPLKNVISWTSLIKGYNDNSYPREALALFKEMKSNQVKPDEVAMLGLVSACSKVGSFEIGQWVDEHVKNMGRGRRTVNLMNALIDMHAKCGNLERACQMFDMLNHRTLVSWTTMIQALGLHGRGTEALIRFSQMQREGFKPDAVIFLCVLSACSHAGLIDEGRKYFTSMIEDHGIEPWMDHYGCMVDLLCRAQQVNRAFEFVKRMPIKPDEKIWRMLMQGCTDKEDFILAKVIVDHLQKLEPQHGGNYIMAANSYAASGEWHVVEKIREEMLARRVSKRDPAYSLIEVNARTINS